MAMLLLVTILLTHCGVLTQVSDWGVIYPDNPVCAVRGFSVSIPCSYYYPQSGHQVTQMLWCSMITNTDRCMEPPYVYNSSSNTTSDFMFTGDNKSDCSLLIHNVQFNYSGEYKFRFITNVDKGRWTGHPGVTLQVGDLKVSLIRLSGNGTLKPGDSLNLTCDVTCTHTSSQFVWSKNNEELNTSGPVLHFPALTTRDSGNYTCTWKTNETSGSKTISFDVKGDQWSVWIIALVVGVIFVIIVILGAVICMKRRKEDAAEENSGKVPPPLNEEVSQQEELAYATVGVKVSDPNNGKKAKGQPNKSGKVKEQTQVPQPSEEVSQQEELTYATVCVKVSNVNNGSGSSTEKEDSSVIYSNVALS